MASTRESRERNPPLLLNTILVANEVDDDEDADVDDDDEAEVEEGPCSRSIVGKSPSVTYLSDDAGASAVAGANRFVDIFDDSIAGNEDNNVAAPVGIVFASLLFSRGTLDTQGLKILAEEVDERSEVE